jgi:hypothetical protein
VLAGVEGADSCATGDGLGLGAAGF